MKLAIVDSQLRIRGTRSELIAVAVELLQCAGTPEYDFDPRDSCSSLCFELDEDGDQFNPTVVHDGLQGLAFVRTKEEPPRESALERAPHEALDAGGS